MKNKVFLFLLPALLLLSGFLFLLLLYRMPTTEKNDIITYNRLAKEAAAHWASPKDGTYHDPGYPFCIISNEGTVLYQSGNNTVTSLSGALTNNNPMIDIEKDGQIVGKVIIEKSASSFLTQYRNSTMLLTLIFLITVAVLWGLYYLYLKKQIITPFQNMEQFASEVSGGNLDFSLEMDKNNLFGAFTESFDRMREQLLLAKEREYQANMNQKELVASLSHDIKTPITSIKLTTELLLELVPEEALRPKLDMIYQKTEQIESLINNLFYSTLQDMEKLEVSPTEQYSSVLTDMIRTADYKNKVKLAPIPECMLYTDELRLTQIISNIITNSYKYAGTDIVVDAVMTDTHLKLSFRDFGRSISEEELPLLFNRFYRGKNAAGISGSGLGLYLCKKLAEQMSGEIYCTCSEDSFTVVLLVKLIG